MSTFEPEYFEVIIRVYCKWALSKAPVQTTHFTCGELNENLLFSLVNCIRLNQRCDVWTKPKTFWKSRRHNYSWKAINFDSVLLVSFQSSHSLKKKKAPSQVYPSIILPYPSRFACCESDTASSFCVPAFFPILVFNSALIIIPWTPDIGTQNSTFTRHDKLTKLWKL